MSHPKLPLLAYELTSTFNEYERKLYQQKSLDMETEDLVMNVKKRTKVDFIKLYQTFPMMTATGFESTTT